MANNNRQKARSKSKSVVNQKGKTLTRSGTVKLGRNEGMREGKSGARAYNVGKSINKRDIKEMQAQGFTDKKIEKVLSTKNKQVKKGASKWLNKQIEDRNTQTSQNPPVQENPGQSTPQPPASPEPGNTPTPDPTDTNPTPAPTTTPATPTPTPEATTPTPEPTPVDPNEGGGVDDGTTDDGVDASEVVNSGGYYRGGDYREGDKDFTYSPDNSIDYDYDGGTGNMNGATNSQGGVDNTNVRDTGDLTQTTDNRSSQEYTNTNDNDNTQDMSNNQGTINNNQQFDNSIRNYGGSTRNFTYNAGNTGAGGSGGGGTETPASMATMGGFFDVDDSPAANARFVDQYSTINSDLQKGHTNKMAGTAQNAINNAAANSYISPEKMDSRIQARQKASLAQANLMGANFFGDQASFDLEWNQPKAPEDPEKPDFEGMYNNMTNF